MDRINKFKKLKEHPMMGKDFKKLSSAEYMECITFLTFTDSLNRNEYCSRVNRWKLDQPNERTKNHTIMWSLLIQSA